VKRLATLLAVTLGLGGCRATSPPPVPGSLNVVLVTLDTLRADRLGAYGFRGAATPRLDALAAEGVLFEQATAVAPLTLPSHASLMTGLLPPHHGVRDNGAFFLAAERTTLAERMQAAGYATGAFVGAFVLDSRFGLDQGFDRYDDALEPGQFQRRGDRVVASAVEWIQGVAGRRFFAWVHLFDPHAPYAAPEPFASRHADAPYLGEVEYTDALVGRLLDALQAQALLERTLVVVTADHGESLGEHGEAGHGFFIYDATTRVPLLVRTPSGRRGRSRTQVSGADVFPTILELAGLPPQPGSDGRSLVRALQDPATELGESAYSETFFPRLHFGWQELRSLRDGHHKFIEAPRPELYDVASDPGETRNVDGKERGTPWREALARIDGGASSAAPANPETRERLAALGYVATPVSSEPGALLPDPKDKVGLFSRLNAAKEAAEAGRLTEAIGGARQVLGEDASILDAHLTLGGWLEKAGDLDGAARSLTRALELSPQDELAIQQLARVESRRDRPDAALAALRRQQAALRDSRNPQAFYQLATLFLEFAAPTDAEAALRDALRIDPGLAAAHNALGALALERGDDAAAETALQRALGLDAGEATLHYNLGRLRERQGRAEDALAEYREETRRHPEHGGAHFALAQLLRKRGDAAGALAALRTCVDVAPNAAPCRFFLAHEELRAGRVAEAEALARSGLALDHASSVAPLGYYVLADVYQGRGNGAAARKAVAQAKALEAALRR
jgi:arylsulfatase A-like enzyme/tetratricopeptide (TPR) repeat protein